MEKGASVEFLRRNEWALLGTVTDKSIGVDAARSIIHSSAMDLAATIGAGRYYDSGEILPRVGVSFNF